MVRALALLVLSSTFTAWACHEGEESDPCLDVECSGHGSCFENGSVAQCDCVEGYHAEGLECVADGADGDADADADTDADADADSDVDADSDGDADGDSDGDAADDADVDGGCVDPGGGTTGGCPVDMIEILTLGICIDRFEASEGSGGEAVSAPCAPPWTMVTYGDAALACAAAGKRICLRTEWDAACQGLGGTPPAYPYGPGYAAEACNGLDHSGGTGGTTLTGAMATCEGGYDGVYDMSGNVSEWVDFLGSARTVGGSFLSESTDLRCLDSQSLGGSETRTDIGFRCCRDLD